MTPEKPNLKRKAKEEPEELDGKVADITSVLGKVVDYLYDADDERFREVTIIDRLQARLLPQLDIQDDSWQYVMEIAAYRKDSVAYETVYGRPQPIHPNLIGIFKKRTAQWAKSRDGKGIERAVDIALAETETRDREEEGYDDKDAWLKE